MKIQAALLMVLLLLMCQPVAHADAKVVVDYNDNDEATPAWKFEHLASPAKNDAATRATFSVVCGQRDRNGGDLDRLHDGGAAGNEDDPSASFFFAAGSEGGRILVDLGARIDVREVCTYSWHNGARGPQVYRLYASDGSASDFIDRPGRDTAPEKCGWTFVATVDSRPRNGELGGQYAVGISGDSGVLGTFRYLLFDVARTEASDRFANTFLSEIDVMDAHGPVAERMDVVAVERIRDVVETGGGKYKIVIDTTETPDLTDWARRELVPLVRDWYPRVVAMLPSRNFVAPEKMSITFKKDMGGVADTGGTHIRCAANWFRENLQGEARGAVFHEMVHVVQQYGRLPASSGPSAHPPGWLVEGMTDYLRFYQYEPQTHGADIDPKNISSIRYNNSYRITANFINWVCTNIDAGFVQKLNAAIREGRFSPEYWKETTGRTAVDLERAWKESLEKTADTSSRSQS